MCAAIHADQSSVRSLQQAPSIKLYSRNMPLPLWAANSPLSSPAWVMPPVTRFVAQGDVSPFDNTRIPDHILMDRSSNVSTSTVVSLLRAITWPSTTAPTSIALSAKELERPSCTRLLAGKSSKYLSAAGEHWRTDPVFQFDWHW